MADTDTPSPAAFTDQEFLAKVQDWLAEKGAPSSEYGPDILADLKLCLAERDATITKAQEAEKSLRALTSQHAALSGKVDGILASLKRVEGAKAPE